MGSVTWGPEIAEVYDKTYAAKFEPSVLGPIVDLLAELARGGPALEFAVGTGRVALPLSARGIAVQGVELSPHMAGQLLAKPGADAVPVTIGDMTTTRVPGTFTLVYLVANTIMNVTTQDDQLAVFANAAAHLEPGGCFVVEVLVPQLRRVPPGEVGWIFTFDADHVGIETFDDLAGQVAWSHHWMEVDGRLVRHSAPYRYVWPSELDLMAKITGFRVWDRWAGWDRTPFTSDSHSQVAVFENCRSHLQVQIQPICPHELISVRMLIAVQNGGYLRAQGPITSSHLTSCDLTADVIPAGYEWALDRTADHCDQRAFGQRAGRASSGLPTSVGTTS
jgi:SAM-dependent methyltransferase